ALAAADRRERNDLSRRCVGGHREAPRRGLGHAGKIAHIGVQVRQLLLVELRERRHDAPWLHHRMIELRERQLAPREIGTIAALSVGAVTVLARRGRAVPERLSCSLITGWRCLGRRKGRENRYQNEREQNSLHKATHLDSCSLSLPSSSSSRLFVQ